MSKTETLFNLKQKKRLEKLKKGFFLHPQRIWSNWENRVSAETRFAAEQIYFAIILSKDIVHKMQLYLHWAALIGREMQKLRVWSLITNYRITIQTKMQMKHYFQLWFKLMRCRNIRDVLTKKNRLTEYSLFCK